MKPVFQVLTSAAALSAAIAVSCAAFAQEPPAGGAPPSAEAMRQHWAEHRHEHAEARAHALHAILNIRPDQEGAFQALMAAMKPPEGAGAMRPGQGGMEALTTPQRLDRMAARMAEHQAAFARRADAVRHFYAALSPEQQRAFDALHGMMGRGHHSHGDAGGQFGHHGEG